MKFRQFCLIIFLQLIVLAVAYTFPYVFQNIKCNYNFPSFLQTLQNTWNENENLSMKLMITPEHNTDGSEIPIFEVIDIISNLSYSKSYTKSFFHKNYNVSIYKPVIMMHEPLFFTVVISPERCNFHNAYPFGDDPCFIVNYSIPIIHSRIPQKKYIKKQNVLHFNIIYGDMMHIMNLVSNEVSNMYMVSHNLSKFIPPFVLDVSTGNQLEIMINTVEKTAFMPFALKIDIISQYQFLFRFLLKQILSKYNLISNMMKKDLFKSLSAKNENL